jgi:hypothetical protein
MKYYLFIFLMVLLAACDDREELVSPSLQNPPIDSTEIVMSSIPDSVLASEGSYGQVVIKVSENILSKYRNVSLQISPIGKFNNDSTTITMPIDINREARVFVKSGQPGIAYVKATIGSASRTTFVKFYKPLFDTLQLVLGSNNVPADNASYAEIVAISKHLDPANRTITFSSDKGVFSNGNNTYSITAGANDTTRAYLKHNSPDIARVTAVVSGSYSKEVFVSFSTAFPQHALLETDSSVLTPTLTAATNVTVQLMRSPGIVSNGQVVHFYDSAAVSPPLLSLGSFFNVTVSDNTGKATAQYRMQTTGYTGLLYIKCYVETPAGRVYGQNTIVVQ